MIEVGQVLLRKRDNGIQSKVVGHCEFEGIQHYYLQELSRIREGSSIPKRNSSNFQQNIVLSDYGIKMAYELPNEDKYRQLKLRNYDNLVSMVAGLFQKNKKVRTLGR